MFYLILKTGALAMHLYSLLSIAKGGSYMPAFCRVSMDIVEQKIDSHVVLGVANFHADAVVL